MHVLSQEIFSSAKICLVTFWAWHTTSSENIIAQKTGQSSCLAASAQLATVETEKCPALLNTHSAFQKSLRYANVWAAAAMTARKLNGSQGHAGYNTQAKDKIFRTALTRRLHHLDESAYFSAEKSCVSSKYCSLRVNCSRPALIATTHPIKIIKNLLLISVQQYNCRMLTPKQARLDAY